MKENSKLEWRKLDNYAQIFPITGGKKYSSVFRLSAVLTDKIKYKELEKAVYKALEIYPGFKVRMKKGVFWYYLEYNTKKIKIEEEKDYPCKYIDLATNNNYLFKITYFNNKINIDIFHSLTDGNSGSLFFKEIIYSYLENMHEDEFKEDKRTAKKLDIDTEDSYVKNYDKKQKFDTKNKRAYKLCGKKIKLGARSVIHQIIDIEDLKLESKKAGVTITKYLTAVLIYCIYTKNLNCNLDKKVKKIKTKKEIIDKKEKPIKICVPVNLKKYFPSKTISNFFSYITVDLNIKEKNLLVYDTNLNKYILDFDKLLEFVKNDFDEKLKEEEVMKIMSNNVKLAKNPVIRAMPLLIKKPIVKLSYMEIRRYTTSTYSNIGRMGIIGKYQKYIKYFLMLIAPEPYEKIKCSSVSFENKMVFTFTSILNDNLIEKEFYNFLINRNIKVEIESNGVLDDISSKN